MIDKLVLAILDHDCDVTVERWDDSWFTACGPRKFEHESLWELEDKLFTLEECGFLVPQRLFDAIGELKEQEYQRKREEDERWRQEHPEESCHSPTRLTVSEITREAMKAWQNRNWFVEQCQDKVITDAEEAKAHGVRIGTTIRVRLPANYTIWK